MILIESINYGECFGTQRIKNWLAQKKRKYVANQQKHALSQ